MGVYERVISSNGRSAEIVSLGSLRNLGRLGTIGRIGRIGRIGTDGINGINGKFPSSEAPLFILLEGAERVLKGIKGY